MDSTIFPASAPDSPLPNRHRGGVCGDRGVAPAAQCAAKKSAKTAHPHNFDRLVFATLYRFSPGVLSAMVIVKPETVIRWHRAGFRLFWRWKSRSRGGKPKVPLEIRQLIRNMSLANP